MASRDLEAAREAYSNADGETDATAIELSIIAHDAPRAKEEHKCAALGAPRSRHPALIEAVGIQERRGVRQEVTIPLCFLAGTLFGP